MAKRTISIAIARQLLVLLMVGIRAQYLF